jgi:hypothetical protein
LEILKVLSGGTLRLMRCVLLGALWDFIDSFGIADFIKNCHGIIERVKVIGF